jgi:hypothetical protein
MGDPQRSDAFDSGRHDRPDWLRGTEPDDTIASAAERASDITRAPGLIGAAESLKRAPQPPAASPAPLEPPAPVAPPASAAPPSPIPLPAREAAPRTVAPSTEPQPPGEIKPWRAASSSVPKLPSIKPSAEPAPRPPGPAEGPDSMAARDTHEHALVTPATARHLPPPPGEATMPAPLPPLPEPWWMVLVDAIRTNRRAQIVTLAVLAAVLVTVILLPQAPQGTPLATIHKDPAAWDGRTVTVSGRVQQAFPLAGGWSFYLVQGRDTMVTFTRSRTPVLGERVVVTGTINTGFLDGVPRQALFEQAAAAK